VILEFLRRFSPLSIEAKILVFLAGATYLASGLYLGFFTAGIDFTLVYEAASRILQGQGASLYTDFFQFRPGQNPLFFMYPPMVALLYTPLAWLPREAAFIVFQIVCQVFLWATLWLLCRRPNVSPDQARRIACLTLLFYPLYYSFAMGQSEAIALGCLVFAFHQFKRGNWLLSSFLLTLAIGLKLFLGLLVVPFLLLRHWKYVLMCAGWLAGWMILSSYFVPPEVLRQYAGKLFSPIGIEAFIDNQSVTGFIYRSLTANAYTTGFLDAPGLARTVSAALSALGLGVYGWTLWTRSKRVPLEYSFSFTLVTALLISPHMDTHHLTFLLIPFIFLMIGEKETSLTPWLYYAFFAAFVPLWGFKFLSLNRGLFFAHHQLHFLLSVPFFVLFAFWMYWVRLIQKCPSH
jgi:hypothetical protein